MIKIVQPLPVGNAIRLFLAPPAGAASWRVLKKASDTFSGPDDPSAVAVYDGDEDVILDDQFLQNDVAVFYRPFYRVAGTWIAGSSATGTPSATFEESSTDALDLLRRRLQDGLHVEVQRGNLQSELGFVQVYTAPPSMERDLRFPLVTLHLESEDPQVRAIGEDVAGDEYLIDSDEWLDSEGWLASVRIAVVGWSLNADERIELRKAMRRVIVGNLPVFDAHGIVQVAASFQDADAVSGEYGAPIYQVMGNFSCLAPVRVGARVNPINNVEVNAING